MNKKKASLATLAVWAGEDEYLMQGATQVPVVHSVAYGYDDMDQWLRVALGEEAGPYLQPQYQSHGPCV